MQMEIAYVPGYSHIRVLGSGNFGTTHMFRENTTNEIFAIKMIPRGINVDENVLKECLNMMSLDHPNVIGFHEITLTDTHLAIVMDLANNGEIFNFVVKKGHLSESESRYIFQQLICGIKYIHDNNICHRDIKLENILLDNDCVVKICDFGYSFNCDYEMPKGSVGTPAYIPPEIIKSPQFYNGFKADIWSCGIVLYVMVYGCYPFEDRSDPRNTSKMIRNIVNGKFVFPEDINVSEECRDLITKMLNVDVMRRSSIDKIMNHPWFAIDFDANRRHVNFISGTSSKKPKPVNSRRQTHEEVAKMVSRASAPNLQSMDESSGSNVSITSPLPPALEKTLSSPITCTHCFTN
jgi:serine/threonine-protein kinase SRK2